MSVLLETRGISVSYGGVRALREVDLDVEAGQLVGLIGPNGAGKTTYIDAITGFTRAEGSVKLAGRDLTKSSSHARAHAGLVRTWQSVELFDDLTVRENLEVAARRPTAIATLREFILPPRPTPAVDQALELLDLVAIADAMPAELSQGQRKLVGLARALAAQAQVICLDEPAAGLDTTESQQLGRRLREIVASGTALLLVDHDMGLVLGICDNVVVLEFGEVIAKGDAAQIRNDEAVVAAYLGSSTSQAIADNAYAEEVADR